MVSTKLLDTSGEELGGLVETDQAISINAHYRIIRVESLGDFLVNNHDTMIEANLRGSLQEVKDLQVFAQGLVVDIGANLGGHSVAFSRTAQLVYAFEPQPHTYGLLCANCAINGRTNIVPMPYALGEKAGTVAISPINPTLEHVCQGASIGEQGQPVQVRTLDSFELSGVSFIKIDVEGYELKVLQGARETLQHDFPVLYIEIHKESLIAPVTSFLGELGYKAMERIIQYTPDGISTRGFLFWIEGRLVFV
jgi:FkbM family methyltransferase